MNTLSQKKAGNWGYLCLATYFVYKKYEPINTFLALNHFWFQPYTLITKIMQHKEINLSNIFLKQIFVFRIQLQRIKVSI